MSTSKHINKICIAAVAVTLVITILFMCGESLGISLASKSVKYESTLFDTSYVHKIDIVMDDWDSFIESCENEEYSTCTVVVDGNKYSNIAIRAKGNTSLSSVKSMGSQRYSFKLEFDHYEDAKMLDGLDKMCLNNLIQDNTMMKDYIAYQLMNDFGADSPLCSFAYLTVNGEDWGLYLAVESIEDSFLSRNYGSDAGDLYKPDSMSFGGGRGNGKDFSMSDFNFDGDGEEDTEKTAGGTQSGEKTKTDTDSSEQSSQTRPGGNFPFGGQGGQTPPEGFDMPEGFTPPDDFPGGQGGFSGGGFPDFSGDDGEGGFAPGGSFPGFSGGTQQDGSDDASSSDGSGKSGRPGGFGGGMGSDDVKLKYIDDDPDSYSNIFDSAKTKVSKADKKRLINSLQNLSSYTDLENVLDMDEVLRYFVVHNFVCNGDSYTGMMIHNYYLHESDGKLSMIPWDYNLAFGTFQGGDASGTINTSIDSPISMGNVDDRPMLGWIFSDESYTEQYHELFAEFIEKWFTNGELEQLIADTAEMIRPYVEKDPTKFCTLEEFDKGVETLSQFVSLRAEAVRRQLNGDDTAVETGDLNTSDMGSMGGGMGKDKGGFPGGFGKTEKTSDEDGENGTEEATVPETTESEVPQQNNESGMSFPGAFSQKDVESSDRSFPERSNENSANGFPERDGESQDSKSGEKSEDGSENGFSGGSFSPPDGFSPPGGATGGQSDESEQNFRILIAVSSLVLAIGIFIAAKKKY